MAKLTQRDFEKQYGEVLRRLQQQATPFPHDTVAKRQARIERARRDKFFFAVTYFPHYIQVKEEYRRCWEDPAKEYDWMDAGFSPDHKEFFEIADKLNVFNIVAGYRESSKDTLIGMVDVVHKLVCGERWFVAVIAENEGKAESKCVPIKIELEANQRLINDFGEQRGTVEWEYGSFITKGGRKVKGYGRNQSLRGETNFGHRPDHIILNDINDPTKPDSAAVVQKFIDSVKMDILKAVNSPRWCGLLLCNWTVKGDIVDALLTGKNTSHYNKRIFRVLVPNEKVSKEDREIAAQCRKAGYPDTERSAWEYRHPTLRLLKERKDDPETFEPEMMMRPRNRKDQKFKDDYFRFHTAVSLKKRKYVAYTFVDSSAKDAGDYKAVITVGLGVNENGDPHIPVLRASIQQESIDWLIDETYRHRQDFNSKVVGVETNGFQILLKKEYLRVQRKKKILLPFKEVVHTGESKESRIERLVPFVKLGTITFDPDDPDQVILIQQLKAFPRGGQVSAGGIGDDGPDGLAGCVELIEDFPHAGEVEYKSIGKQTARFAGGAW